MSKPIRITVEHRGLCLTCEEPINAEDEAFWEPKVGVWHIDCDAPSNLHAYRRSADDRERARKLGL